MKKTRRPFSCGVCKAAFSVLDSLVEHVAICKETLVKPIEITNPIKVESNNFFKSASSDRETNFEDTILKSSINAEISERILKKKVDNNSSISKNQSENSLSREIDSKTEEKKDFNVYSLPYGWKKVLKIRNKSLSHSQYDIYVSSPSGKILRSQNEIETYLIKNPDVKCDREVTHTKLTDYLRSVVSNFSSIEKNDKIIQGHIETKISSKKVI